VRACFVREFVREFVRARLFLCACVTGNRVVRGIGLGELGLFGWLLGSRGGEGE
jgi:hypothetical protein